MIIFPPRAKFPVHHKFLDPEVMILDLRYKDFISNSTALLLEIHILRMLTLFRMGVFGPAQGWCREPERTLSLKSSTHPTMMKSGTIIPYLKKIQKMYNGPIEFC